MYISVKVRWIKKPEGGGVGGRANRVHSLSILNDYTSI